MLVISGAARGWLDRCMDGKWRRVVHLHIQSLGVTGLAVGVAIVE